jgi:hypothetical protein
METEALRTAAFNLVQAQRWYRLLMAEAADGWDVRPVGEQEAIDACLEWARKLRRELDAERGPSSPPVDARRVAPP